MAQFITFNELKDIGAQITEKRAYVHNFSQKRDFDTFLSHSSADDELLPAVIKILTNHGANVYVDDGDERLPKDPSPETAKILKNTIRDCRRFVLFVTTNSKDSRWIPWELGLGDGMKSEYSVALFPSAENWYETSWSEQEYLGLYRRIVWGEIEGRGKKEWIVQNHHKNSATPLGAWLRGN